MKYTIITTILAAFLLSPASFADHCAGDTSSNYNKNLGSGSANGGTSGTTGQEESGSANGGTSGSTGQEESGSASGGTSGSTVGEVVVEEK